MAKLVTRDGQSKEPRFDFRDHYLHFDLKLYPKKIATSVGGAPKCKDEKHHMVKKLVGCLKPTWMSQGVTRMRGWVG